MDIAPATRASTAERERVVELLGGHLADGRLDVTEYDRRLAHVYAATTRDDVDSALADLPRRPRPAAPPAANRRRLPLWMRIEGAAWLGVGLLNLAIWALVSIGVGSLVYFWPIWVIGPWGAVLAARAISGFESGRCRLPV